MKILRRIRRFYVQNSIHKSLLSSFTVLLLAAFLFFVPISIHLNSRAVRQKSMEYTTQLIEQVSRQLDAYINYTENISRLLIYNNDIHRFITEQANDSAATQELRSRIYEQFSTLLTTREDISNLALFGVNGQSIINRGYTELNPAAQVKNMDWYQRAASADKGIQVSAPHVQNLFKDNYTWVVTLSRGIFNKETQKLEGVLMVDLNYNEINRLCRNINLGKKGYVFIVNQAGEIIYHPQQQLIFSGLRQEAIDQVLAAHKNPILVGSGSTQRIMNKVSSAATGWIITGVAYADELTGDIGQTLRLYALLAAVFLVAGFFMSLLLSFAFVKPIHRLQAVMSDMPSGSLPALSPRDYPDNEIGQLASAFNIMTQKISSLMEENIREQAAKRHSELQALQSQINPHFLYNTLDSIIWMAEDGKNAEVVEMTASLAGLLRQSISNEREMVSIAEEIGYVCSYLVILKMRYQNKLNYSIDVAPEIQPLMIIKLVLQPLVENAVYHGIKYKESGGFIKIVGRLDEDGQTVTLRVIDNGPGIPPEKMAHLFDPLDSDSVRPKVGLPNVYERLQLYYGKEYGLTIDSQLGVGTEALIRIPATQAEQEALHG